MSNAITIAAEVRDGSGKGAARATRRAGLVPGVIYGAKQAAICIQMDPRVVWAQISKTGFFTQLFNVDLGKGGKHLCLARDVQMHPVTDQPIHVDFMRVPTDHAIHVKVPVHFANETKSPGIKKGGVLNVEMHEIEITCTAENIPHEIVVDLAGLEIGASVHLKDLKLPAGAKPYHVAADATVASIAAPTVSRAETTETEAAG
jgi:large subunit ribosomal protein L25